MFNLKVTNKIPSDVAMFCHAHSSPSDTVDHSIVWIARYGGISDKMDRRSIRVIWWAFRLDLEDAKVASDKPECFIELGILEYLSGK
jgi:hypothetical protein